MTTKTMKIMTKQKIAPFIFFRTIIDWKPIIECFLKLVNEHVVVAISKKFKII